MKRDGDAWFDPAAWDEASGWLTNKSRQQEPRQDRASAPSWMAAVGGRSDGLQTPDYPDLGPPRWWGTLRYILAAGMFAAGPVVMAIGARSYNESVSGFGALLAICSFIPLVRRLRWWSIAYVPGAWALAIVLHMMVLPIVNTSQPIVAQVPAATSAPSPSPARETDPTPTILPTFVLADGDFLIADRSFEVESYRDGMHYVALQVIDMRSQYAARQYIRDTGELIASYQEPNDLTNIRELPFAPSVGDDTFAFKANRREDGGEITHVYIFARDGRYILLWYAVGTSRADGELFTIVNKTNDIMMGGGDMVSRLPTEDEIGLPGDWSFASEYYGPFSEAPDDINAGKGSQGEVIGAAAPTTPPRDARDGCGPSRCNSSRLGEQQ